MSTTHGLPPTSVDRRTAPQPRLGEKGFKVLAHNPVQDGALRLAAHAGGTGAPKSIDAPRRPRRVQVQDHVGKHGRSPHASDRGPAMSSGSGSGPPTRAAADATEGAHSEDDCSGPQRIWGQVWTIVLERTSLRAQQSVPLHVLAPPWAGVARKAQVARPSSNGRRNCPVLDAGVAAITSGGPTATISPPRSPPSGPMSIT